MPDRASIIDTRLANHFHNDIGVNVSTPEPTWWWNNLDTLGPWGVLGIGIPINHPDTGEIIVPFCPQVIEEQTRTYTDEEFVQYLLLLQSVLDYYIIEHEETDRNERHHLVVSRLTANSPEGLDEIAIQLEMADFRYALNNL
jgi:hypothetical protein